MKTDKSAVRRFELEQESDGRWIVEAVDCPGAIAYGRTPEEALRKALSIVAEAAEVKH